MAADSSTGIDPRRMVVVFYGIAAVVVGVFLEKIIALGLSYARLDDPAIFGEDWSLSTVVGFVIAVAAAVILWRNARVRNTSLEVAGELKKVTWPTMRETRAATVAVVVATFVAAVILGVFDFVWAKLSSLVY